MRVVVGGIGYRHLRDHSVGIEVIDRLARRPWPASVAVEDLSYNPIAVIQRLEDELPDRPFERAVLVGAVARGRRPGTVTAYRWDGRLPPEEEIQRAVTEAVTGVIALDNTVVVAGHFGAWPPEVAVVEVEPLEESFGETFSEPVAAVMDEVCETVTRLATGAGAVAALPWGPLGGPAAPDHPDLLEEAERLMATLQAHPDPAVGAQLRRLLECIDTVHRTGLTRLAGAIHGMAGEAFVNRLAADPAIRLLLMSYNLLAVDRRLVAEEALDAVRGHLHAHGIDVELVAVTGGAVWVRLHGLERGALPAEAVRRDVEAALAAGLPGFQELTVGQGPLHPQPPLLQIGTARLREPRFRTVCAAGAVPSGTIRAVEVEGHPVLLANIGGEIHAVADRCGESPLPLRFGALQGAEVRCSWHGCRYDVRSGARLDRPGQAARVYPVRIEDGEIRVAVAAEAS